jgi:hypothetical protein
VLIKCQRAELGQALDEMNKGGAFQDIELDYLAMQSLFFQGGEQEWKVSGRSWFNQLLDHNRHRWRGLSICRTDTDSTCQSGLEME